MGSCFAYIDCKRARTASLAQNSYRKVIFRVTFAIFQADPVYTYA